MGRPRSRVVAFIPILRPLPGFWPDVSAVAHSLDQIVQLTGLDFIPSDPNISATFVLSLHDRPFGALAKSGLPEDTAFMRTYRRRRHLRDWKVLRLATEIELLNVVRWTHHEGSDVSEVSEEESIELTLGFFPSEMENLVYRLTLAANIAAPATIEIGAGSIYQDGTFVQQTQALISDLGAAYAYAQRTGWPTLSTLAIQQVWNWLIAGEYLDGTGNSPTSRAVNALSQCFGPPGASNPMQLFWALMGVEALFSEDAPGVKSLVAQRAQLLLGEQRSFRKDFSEIYQTRSAFVHGGLPFPAAFSIEDASSFHDRIGKAQAVASAVLVAALQDLIRRGWHSLSFPVAVRGE